MNEHLKRNRDYWDYHEKRKRARHSDNEGMLQALCAMAIVGLMGFVLVKGAILLIGLVIIGSL
jgi:hypothetical protein